MREFKFRAWDKQNKKMTLFSFDDIYGYEGEVCGVILPDQETVLTYDRHYQHNDGKGINKDLEIMQYTGLKDKNGKEIYEGDIIKWTEFSDDIDRLGIVRFGEGTYDSGAYRFQGFYLEIQGYYKYDYKTKNSKWTWGSMETDGTANTLMSDYHEVIGNIYENPELLKKQFGDIGEDTEKEEEA